ncbi:MAG: hypothetical protein IKP47_07790 [Ruminococcus sp.]|nr:hypothetical protein [Ruminococcus sp.]
MSFQLVQGVSADDLDGICSAYTVTDDYLDSVVSAELIRPVLEGVLDKLEEPHFFFVEIPCTEAEEKQLRKFESDPTHRKVYYLDGCTREVSFAILKRYGELLINDGLTRFGFGSNKTNDEVYVMDYQQIRIFGMTRFFEPVFRKLGVPETDELRTLWDNFSPEHPGVSSSIEVEGERCEDIVENLSDEGMYYAETR